MENALFHPHIHWNSINKFLLRFGTTFFGIYLISQYSLYFTEVCYSFYPWIGSSILHLDTPIVDFPQGSGDTRYNYVELLFCFITALLITSIWSLLSKRSKTYDRFLHWFLIAIRYLLVMNLVSYGYQKIFYLQFSPPSLYTLLEPYGESSPMGLAWNFIGYSKVYTVISGYLEFAAGIFLLFRRTTLLGALLSLIVMFNVMLINYCYDVPVKLFSTQLVIYSIIIIVCNSKAIWSALWKHTQINETSFKPITEKKWLRITRVCLKVSFILYFVVFDCYNQYQMKLEYVDNISKPSLYGLYKPKLLIKNSDTLKLYSDSTLWKKLAVLDWPNSALLYQVNDRKRGFYFNVDTIKKTIVTYPFTDTLVKYKLNYHLLNDTTLQLKGVFIKDTINYTLEKVNIKSFLLTSRGFNWVNEYPLNR